MEATFVIVGGGVAGVMCAETLSYHQPNLKVILISESSLIKTVTNLHAITETLSEFSVEEQHMDVLMMKHKNVTVIQDALLEIRDKENFVVTKNNVNVKYKFLCLCMGARPKLIADSPYVVGIRDTDSVDHFMQKLAKSKKVCIIGNGGIASELVHKIKQTQIDWVIKDKHITATFVDPGAAEFFKDKLDKTLQEENDFQLISKRMHYTENGKFKAGAALGPDWYKNLDIHGAIEDLYPTVNIHYECEMESFVIKDEENPVEIKLTNGEIIKSDFIVSATGVIPRTDIKMDTPLILSEEKGVFVNEFMQSNITNIYAAGDICTPGWDYASKLWFPMKLWTQAWQMGCYAANCMSAALTLQPILPDFCFELFTHTTTLFGYKVILLGLYNGQTLGTDYEILFRMTKGVEYIKLVLRDNRLQGAVLIGDTNMEETFENLIHDKIDLSDFKDDLLDPNIDIEDFFD